MRRSGAAQYHNLLSKLEHERNPRGGRMGRRILRSYEFWESAEGGAEMTRGFTRNADGRFRPDYSVMPPSRAQVIARRIS